MRTALSLLGLMFFSVLAFAQEVTPISNEDFISALLQSLGGIKGASVLAIVGLVVQLIMKFIGTPWADSLLKNSGQWKLTLVLLLSYVGGVVTLMATTGVPFGTAVLHASVMSSLMVLINQIYKQFFVKTT